MKVSRTTTNLLLCILLAVVDSEMNSEDRLTPPVLDHVISKNHVDYYPGSPYTNVVMTAPHDGHIKPASIPDRQKGCYNTTAGTCDWHHHCTTDDSPDKCKIVDWADLRSADLAIEMRKAISARTGHVPHLIISRLHRSKLDPNRERDNAAQHNPEAELTYDTFHGLIQEAHEKLAGNPGVHFDIHGYTKHNTDNWLELGYNIHGSDLNAGNLDYNQSSIRSLAGRSSASFLSLVSGKDSLGWEVEQEGFRVVPSPQYPRPELGVEGKYFRGGYITRAWGSLSGGVIDCVQLEVPQWTRDHSAMYGERLGRAFGKWVVAHYPGKCEDTRGGCSDEAK